MSAFRTKPPETRLMKCLRIAIVALAYVMSWCSDSRAERVGYSFAGALQVFGSGNTMLFNVSVPKNSPVKGTFSYDTAIHDETQSSQPYHQNSQAGFTLDINNG